MKAATLILISVLCLRVEGYLIKVPTSPTTTKVATGGWAHIQKLLLPLFENVCEESTEPTIVRLNQEFKLGHTDGLYLKSEVIDDLQNLKTTKGLLPKGEIFTESNADHLNELKVIFELLYYAKDFDTFYKAACWARQNINCGLFVDALYLAILNRHDTEKILIPTPYEVLPNYFVRKDFIIKASSLIRGEGISSSDSVRNEGNAYILDVNYTSGFYDDDNDKLAYFHEDVGLSTYNYLTILNNLPWLSNLQKNNNGQHLYHMMKQMMARYNLERYSNGLPELEDINWDNINEVPYDPLLVYSNGNEFSQRLTENIGNSEVSSLLNNIEDNLPAVVIHMRDGGYNKSDILNHLMDIIVTNDRSYINLASQILIQDKISRSPTVLEHYMTSVRDPIFWKLNKKIVDMIDNALQMLPSYLQNELYLPGVEIQNIEVKKMMTMFDNLEFDVTNALKVEGEDSKFNVKISQSRLNHKPFSFKINVSSLIAQKALVKIYIGPKVMPGEIVEKKNLFMLLDSFDVNLKVGSNVIAKASSEMENLSDDLFSLETLHKYVLDSEFGVSSLPLKSIRSQIGFPSRLILPRGTSDGLPLHVFVFIAPYVKSTIGGSSTKLELNTEAVFAPGYPFDLNIDMQQLLNLPNVMVKDITIIHKTEATFYNKSANNYNFGSNSNIWQSAVEENNVSYNLLTLNTRPEFTKKTFDYKSKKNQYNKNTDYTAKRGNYKYQGKNGDEIKLDDNKIFVNSDIVKNNDFEKFIEIENHEIRGKTEPDIADTVTSIYINRDSKDDKTLLYNEDVTPDYLVILDKDPVNDVSLYPNAGNLDNNDFKKIIDIKNSNVNPHGLLSTPRKKYSNVINILLNPLKFDSNENVYE